MLFSCPLFSNPAGLKPNSRQSFLCIIVEIQEQTEFLMYLAEVSEKSGTVVLFAYLHCISFSMLFIIYFIRILYFLQSGLTVVYNSLKQEELK